MWHLTTSISRCLAMSRKPNFGQIWANLGPTKIWARIFFFEIWASSLFWLTSIKRSYERFPRNTPDERTNGQTNGGRTKTGMGESIGPTSKVSGSKKCTRAYIREIALSPLDWRDGRIWNRSGMQYLRLYVTFTKATFLEKLDKKGKAQLSYLTLSPLQR